MLLASIIPGIYHIITDTSNSKVFSYYSSVEEAYCTKRYVEEGDSSVRVNEKTGRIYTKLEFDSILPMFYYRQLLSDGRFPDTIKGRSIDHKKIRSSIFYNKYDPINKNSPSIPIYTLFESSSGRVRLEMPGDFFRIKNKIEFIDPETNKVKFQKSALFMNAFKESDFVFPAKFVACNPIAKKAYEEGCFIIDAIGQIFHLKMVKGKPYLKNTNFPKSINPVYMELNEPEDRSFYGFIFDKNSKLYLLTTDEYKIQKLKSPSFNIDKDRLVIMGNPFYWHIDVTSSRGKESFALDASTKQVVDSISFINDKSEGFILSYVLPFEINFTPSKTRYQKLTMKIATVWVLISNLVFCLVYILFVRRKKRRINLAYCAWIFITGIYGVIPCMVINK